MITNEQIKTISENPKEVVNAMNSHFASVAEKLSEQRLKTDDKFNKYLGEENKASIFLKNIDLNEIAEEIANLDTKKAMGHDEIPPKIIKWAPHLFSPILKNIYNKCIDLGYYPDGMKIAKVTPIYKKGDKNDLNC